MRSPKRTFILATLVALLAGCASPVPIPERAELGARSAIYVYWPAEITGLLSCAKFKVDGGQSQPLSNGGGIRFDVEPGTRMVEAETSACFRHDIGRAVPVDPGQVAFVRLTRSRTQKFGYSPPQLIDDPWTGLEIVPRDTALREMKR